VCHPAVVLPSNNNFHPSLFSLVLFFDLFTDDLQAGKIVIAANKKRIDIFLNQEK